MQNIVLHTTASCPKCKVLKEKLDASNIVYIENSDVDKMLSMGIQTVPVLEIDGDLINFSAAVKLIGGGRSK